MKKLLFSLTFVLVGTMAFANGFLKKDINSQTVISTVTKNLSTKNDDSFIEVKRLIINGLETCYIRSYKIVSTDNGNGTTTETKVCGSWLETPCSTVAV